MKICHIRESHFADVLRLNEENVPHVNLIDKDELVWFVAHASFARIALLDDRLAGFIVGMRPGTTYSSPNYRWFCDNYTDFAYIDRVAVAPWARRQRVAESLYEAFRESATGAGVMTCEINVRPPNDGSFRFHERYGFRKVATQEINNGEKEVAMMEKKL